MSAVLWASVEIVVMPLARYVANVRSNLKRAMECVQE